MKWTKRTAALLASLLLLSTVAQARDVTKAPPRAGRTIVIIQSEPPQDEPAPQSVTKVQKRPVLPVKTEEPELPELPIQPELPEVLVTPLETEEPKAPGPAETPEAPAVPEIPIVSEVPAVPEPRTPEKIPAEGPSFPEAEDWQLLLVNPWNELPEDYEVNLKALPDGMKVDERAYDDLSAMLRACRDDGLAPKICSAYRTMSKQTYLYNNKIARLRNAGYSKSAAEKEAGRWVARPGTSEHQLGLAVDIVSTSYQALTKKQERTAEQKWLMEHCWEYGFILRYPNDKSEITGIGYEPWHYRYVGREVALDVRESGLCFEEYLALREETLAARN